MILQLSNIIAGTVLALPRLKSYVANKDGLTKLEAQILPYSVTIGVIELMLGVVGFLVRIGILPYIPELGASYPQSIPAILCGSLLAISKFAKYRGLQKQIKKLAPHAFSLGLLAVAVGLGSLLFGCFIPTFCKPW